MEVTDRPQEQAECLDEKKSYKDMTESPRKCVKETKKREMKSDRKGLSANLKKKKYILKNAPK